MFLKLLQSFYLVKFFKSKQISIYLYKIYQKQISLSSPRHKKKTKKK